MSLRSTSVVVVDALRTPIGARNGVLSGWHAADLVAEVLHAMVRRTGIDPATVDDVVLGCSSPVGDQGANVARNAVLAAGWPESVPATTVDAQGTSALRALAMAADAIGAGSAEVVVAGGVEVSSTTPAGAWAKPAIRPFGPGVIGRYADLGGLVPPGVAAEALAERRGLAREALDNWARTSRRRAREATTMIDGGVLAVAGRGWDRERRQTIPGPTAVAGDELVTSASCGDDLSEYKPMFVPDGRITAANSAPAGDGAAGLLVMAEGRAKALGLGRLARIVASASGGVDPRTMLTGAVPATTRAMNRAGLDLADVERFEVDESFAAVTLDWMSAFGIDPGRVNVGGGALARGLASGAAGAAMVVDLTRGLRQAGGGCGLVALGGMGGVGTAVVIESPSSASGTIG